MPKHPDINDTLLNEGADAVRARSERAVEYDGTSPSIVPEIVGPLILSTAEFIGGFVPPDYLADGLMQRRFLYSMTAPTGGGKTAVAICLAIHIDQGLPLAGREVTRGKVLYLAGENPDDVRMRWIAQLDQMKIDPASSNVFWSPGSLTLSDVELRKRIDEESAKHGPFALVCIDTSAAYFSGDDENSNVQMGAHARMLRTFVNISGGPTVLVLCHPIKNANTENLLPRGGGAFLNEMDGNLVCLKKPDSNIVEVHWHGKFRGPDFQPIPFTITTVKTHLLLDSKGRAVPTVNARAITQLEVNEDDAAADFRQDRLLAVLKKNLTDSIAELGRKCGWLYASGEPNKTLVYRTLLALEKAKLIKKEGRGWEITKAGMKVKNGDSGDETISEDK